MTESEEYAKGNVKNASGDYANTSKVNVSKAISGQSPLTLKISLPGARLGVGSMENS
jgi:hypothetical protein